MHLTAALVRAVHLVRGGVPRRVWIVALVSGFAMASLLNAMSLSIAADNVHAAAVSHGDSDAHTMHDASCDDDCDCHNTFGPADCCVHSAPVAAIWTSMVPLPKLEVARCAHADGEPAACIAIDPPTPPPRSVLG